MKQNCDDMGYMSEKCTLGILSVIDSNCACLVLLSVIIISLFKKNIPKRPSFGINIEIVTSFGLK